jgi:hypothetical protein
MVTAKDDLGVERVLFVWVVNFNRTEVVDVEVVVHLAIVINVCGVHKEWSYLSTVGGE